MRSKSYSNAFYILCALCCLCLSLPWHSNVHRSLKREMRTVSEECGLQPVTIAMAYVYFEKLVLQGRLNKHNRKLVSSACVLLAAKISSDLKKHEVKQLMDVSGTCLKYYCFALKFIPLLKVPWYYRVFRTFTNVW